MLNKASDMNKAGVENLLNKYGIIIGFITIILFLSFASPIFLKPANLVNILRQMSIIGIASMGMTLIIIMGCIDLSLGSTLALVGVVSALLARNPAVPVFAAVLAGIVCGGVVGLINGFVVAKGKIPPFIVTLGTMTMIRGLAFILANGMPVGGLPKSFYTIGSKNLMGIPFPIIIFFLIFVLSTFILKKTAVGRYIYAIGGNETAACAAGINVDRIKIKTYVIAGFFTGLAGVVLASRIKSGQPAVASGYELDAIAACIIGGVSFTGGIGTALGTILGSMILGVINNGLDLLNVQTFYQQIVKGAIIIIAVLADRKRIR